MIRCGRLMVGLHGLEDRFQSRCFYDSVNLSKQLNYLSSILRG